MLEYVKVKKFKHIKRLINLWNSEFRYTYPIKAASYKRLILDDVNLNKDASFIALYDNEPVGFLFVKTWFNDSGLANEHDTAHISLMFVKKEMRNMGLGSDMLKLATSELRKYHNINKLVVGNEMNKIFSGSPSDLNQAAIFFKNKGFVQKESLVDMIQVIKTQEPENLDSKELLLTVATEEDKYELLQLCVNNGWKREAFLINQYFENGGSGRRIVIGVIDDKKIVAFARLNHDNKKRLLPKFLLKFFAKRLDEGSINFVRIDQKYYSKEYETIMNQAAKNYLLKRGCKKVIVLATQDIDYYKNLGYSVHKYYLQFELPL